MEEKSFVVSARKYRPDSWESVVGQEAITSTLASAIANNQLATGYLFCGPRGVGKTSCARIFAKEVNKGHTEEGDDFSFNVFELDAASNNKVEHIRSLIDQVRIPPQNGKFKVYIIDEVHMLTTQAFNAFLKTLEEPPRHAIFILATTEKHKIIPTILSRCQIFDFRRIGVDDIAAHLASIADKEGIPADKEALHIIAQKADGALRDALSIFDQLASFTGRNLTYEAVIENLNVLDHQYYFRSVDNILSEEVKANLLLLDDIVRKGFDPHHFVEGLGEHFRNLMMAKNPETVELMELAEQVKEKMIDQAEKCDIHLIIKALEFISECDQHYRMSMNQRMTVELLLMQLSSIPHNLREKKNDEFELIAPDGMTFESGAQRTPTPPEKQENSSDKSELRRLEKPTGKSKEQLKRDKNYSLTELLQESEVSVAEKETEEKYSTENEPFTEEQLMKAYNKATEKLRKSHGENLYHILTGEPIQLKRESEIYLRLHNSAQSLAIDTIRQLVVDNLRSELRNSSITLHTFVQKEDDGEDKSILLSGDPEKYQKMLEHNPNLDKLRIALKLDFED